MAFLRKLFDTGGYPPRWECGNWSPFVGWLHIVSDSLIFLAYAAIPVALAIILFRRRDVPFPWILRLFVAFILLCGCTHLIEAIIFYHPIYRFQGVVKAATAIVSLVTAFVLIRSLPELLALRRIKAKNLALATRLGEMRSEAHALARERSDLETHSAQVGLTSRRVISALGATGGVACRWTLGADAFDWEVGLMECARRTGLSTHIPPQWSALIGPAADRLHELCRANAESEVPFDFDAPVVGAPSVLMLLRATPEPSVQGHERTMIGFFRLWTARPE